MPILIVILGETLIGCTCHANLQNCSRAVPHVRRIPGRVPDLDAHVTSLTQVSALQRSAPIMPLRSATCPSWAARSRTSGSTGGAGIPPAPAV